MKFNNYYVYAYIRESDGTPYYIGKGQRYRLYSKRHGVSVPKDRSKIIILEKNLTNIGALALERRYIRWYGRKDLGTGILYNRTDGGDTTCGYTPSLEHRKKLSIASKGKKKPKGFGEKISAFRKTFKYSEESKKKISIANKGKKRTPEQVEEFIKRRTGFIQPESQKIKVAEKLSKKWKITDTNGNTFEVLNLSKFCKENALDQGNLSRGSYKGWKASKIN